MSSLPAPLCFFSSAFHGSHASPYFLSNLPSSALCSFYIDNSLSAPLVSTRAPTSTHQYPGLLPLIHMVKHLPNLRLRQSLCFPERLQDLVLEARFERVIFLGAPPAACLEEAPEARERVVQALAVLDLLAGAIRKRVVGG